MCREYYSEAAMKSQVDKLTSERLLLQESLDKAKQRTELLSAKISSFNDEVGDCSSPNLSVLKLLTLSELWPAERD